jgi:hypothetical protein
MIDDENMKDAPKLKERCVMYHDHPANNAVLQSTASVKHISMANNRKN